VEGRNTQDIDIIMALPALSKLPEIKIESQDMYFARGKFGELQIDILLTKNLLFDQVAKAYSTEKQFISHLRIKRQFHVSATLSNGDVLIAGGYDYDGNPPQETLASVELFSVKSMSVSPHGRMSARRYFTAATFLPNNAVLITGGVGENGETLDSAELYNPLTGSFTLLSPMMIKRRSHTSILLRNGKVLILGGSGNENKQIGSRLTSAEIYDPTTNTFTKFGELIESRCRHTASLLPNGQVIIIGGANNNGHSLSSIEKSNISYNALH
jgi:hypothetical protein